MSVSPSTPARLASLDVLRGLTLIGMIFINYADVLEGLGYHVFPLLLHASWAGFHIADSVFPAFVTMTGVSIPLARGQGGLGGAALKHLSVRSLRLILIGMVISNTGWLFAVNGEDLFRPEGVLQRIGIAYFGAAALYLSVGGRTRLLIAGALLLSYWPLCLLPSPDGVATDLLIRGANFSSWVDRAIFGLHTYVQHPIGFDPEGLLGMGPAVAQALIGVAVGEWVIARNSPSKLALAGVAMIVTGIAWGLVFPIVKALWSSSFVLLSTGITVVVLSALYWALDLKGWNNPVTRFPSDFGINSIFAYCLHEGIAGLLAAPTLKLLYDFALPALGQRTAALIPSIVVVLLIWTVLRYMRIHRWIVKV